jgi:hyperosmotically inducible periplasmic protein
MTLLRSLSIVTLMLIAAVTVDASVASAQSRTVGEVIDDTSITAEVTAKLTADRLANLTQIGVNTRNRIVTLTGTVDSLERQARAAQIAAAVKGVRGVVNNIQVAGAPNAPAPPVAAAPDQPTVDVTGVVAHVDPATGTITLQDGRVLRITNQTIVWQPVPIETVRPGAQVLVRSAVPVVVQPGTGSEWSMGTVASVDRARSQLVLTDGTVVRVPPAVNIRRGSERLTLEQIVPGSEVVIRPMAPSPTATAEGSAMPGLTGTTTAAIDAAEINVAWTPASGPR